MQERRHIEYFIYFNFEQNELVMFENIKTATCCEFYETVKLSTFLHIPSACMKHSFTTPKLSNLSNKKTKNQQEAPSRKTKTNTLPLYHINMLLKRILLLFPLPLYTALAVNVHKFQHSLKIDINLYV